MKILDRLGVMLRADAHGMMDRLEARSLLVRQHLRDAEIALEHERGRLADLDESLRRTRESARRVEARVAELEADVSLALERGEEALARHAVRRLLPQRIAQRRLRERAAELGEARERRAAGLQAREAAFEALRDRARERLASLERAERDGAPEAGCAEAVTEADVELELLRRRRAAETDGAPTREVTS